MIEIESKQDINRILEKEKNYILYIGTESCSICKDLYPKVEKLLENYPKLKFFKLDYGRIPSVSGMLSIHTVPAILGYIEGSEFIREARFISIGDIKSKIERYYEFI